jgi:hypothetical protein
MATKKDPPTTPATLKAALAAEPKLDLVRHEAILVTREEYERLAAEREIVRAYNDDDDDAGVGDDGGIGDVAGEGRAWEGVEDEHPEPKAHLAHGKHKPRRRQRKGSS